MCYSALVFLSQKVAMHTIQRFPAFAVGYFFTGADHGLLTMVTKNKHVETASSIMRLIVTTFACLYATQIIYVFISKLFLNTTALAHCKTIYIVHVGALISLVAGVPCTTSTCVSFWVQVDTFDMAACLSSASLHQWLLCYIAPICLSIFWLTASNIINLIVTIFLGDRV